MQILYLLLYFAYIMTHFFSRTEEAYPQPTQFFIPSPISFSVR